MVGTKQLTAADKARAGALTDIPIVILAGGKSTRMGRDKLALSFGGTTLLAERAAEFRARFANVYLSVAAADSYPEIDCARIIDSVERCGPMGALYSALSQLKSGVFLCAGDMPYASSEAALRLLEQVQPSGADIVWAEPTFAYYAESVLAVAGAHIASRDYKLRGLIPELWSVYYELPERELFNVNTPEDYALLNRGVETGQAQLRRK
ncbi:MAG: molybdenum cofactor guanylyltransferase [Oscillospiraceae bacterium]|nr:molybdenum cofactor guanylyltransferase [Oscillospiraceae bacterium]